MHEVDRRLLWFRQRLHVLVVDHIAMIAPFHMHYSFAPVHKTLRVTPVMEAGISPHVWSIFEFVALTTIQPTSLAAWRDVLGFQCICQRPIAWS